jgi:zinc protease
MARDPGIARRVLGSGLVLLVSEQRKEPLFTAMLSIEAGSRYERKELAGVAALTASALVEGTAGRSAGQIAEAIDGIGATLDVVPSYETVTLSITGLSRYMADALEILHEIVSEPLFNPVDIEDSRRALLSEIAEDVDDPYHVAQRELSARVFAGHPRSRPTNGTRESVARLSRDEMADHFARRYTPGNSVLSIAGHVDSERALALAERCFEHWKGDKSEQTEPAPPDLSAASRSDIRMRREQVHIVLGHLGVARAAPDFYALRVLDVILGDGAGFTSRLAIRLRESKGLSYVIESDITGSAGLDPGLFWVYTATLPSQAEQAIECIRSELERARSEEPTEQEQQSSIAYLLGQRLADRETTEGICARAISIERYSLGLDYDARYPDIIGSVTSEQVLKAARRVLHPDLLSVVLVGPRADSTS